ncbi:hypothetical protein Btru_051870 [Bulinus truncatus]|nr:hypothetical protein Btru_051870 [Bulinus truncatus]
MVLENGTWINLFCEADGNPAPLIKILRQNELLSHGGSLSYISINKLMTCEDTGSYICQANNGVNIAELQHLSTKNISLFVKCRLQLNNTKDFQTFKLHSGQIFSYNLSVYGFPTPSNFKVLKSGRVTNNLIVTYSATELPYGIIELKLSNVTSSDFDNYTVIMFQNGSQSLNYSFYITEANETNRKEENNLIAAAVGGGIGAGCFIIFVVIIFSYLCKRGTIKIPKKPYESKLSQNITVDTENNDIYSLPAEMTGDYKNIIRKQTYKNYQDIVPTITSATAVPKNMYKPKVKAKPRVDKSASYYNFVQPIALADHNVSDMKKLLDDNVYANQGFIKE